MRCSLGLFWSGFICRSRDLRLSFWQLCVVTAGCRTLNMLLTEQCGWLSFVQPSWLPFCWASTEQETDMLLLVMVLIVQSLA